MKDTLILVDGNDNEIGYEEKEKCHDPPMLHRAFSVFLFNGRGEMLITKRSSSKNRWPGFWSNTCCSHPRKGEDTKNAAKRRLKEELGINTDVDYLFKFEYSADYNGKPSEHELDWVFVGRFSGKPELDMDEIDDWKYIPVDDLKNDVRHHPEKYTPWFKICIGRVIEHVNTNGL